MPSAWQLLALILLPAASPTPTPAWRPAASVRFDSGKKALAIPLETAGNGLLFVRGTVRGSPLWFLLDTASASVVSARAAIQLGLETQSQDAYGKDAEGASAVERLAHVAVRLPGIEIEETQVSSFDLSLLQTALGHPIDGILGVPFFENLVVVTDYAAGRLDLYDPEAFRATDRKHSMTISRDRAGWPGVRARLKVLGRDELEGDFLLDSGADNTVLLFSPFVSGNRLLDPSAKVGTEEDAVAVASLGAVLRAERLAFSQWTFSNPIVELSRSTKGKTAGREHAGLLGGALLSRFRVTWNYAAATVTLRPNSQYRDPFGYDASGVSLAAQGPDLSTFEIRRVAPASPGAEANLLPGDVVLAVDGTPVKQITLRGVRKLFQKDGKRYVLSILRDGAIQKIPLTCRRML